MRLLPRMKEGRKTFSGFLASYILVFILPMAALITIFIYFNNNLYRTEVIHANNNLIAKTGDNIDYKLLNIDEIAKQLGKSSQLSPKLIQNNALAWIDVIEQLRVFDGPYDIIDDIVYYIPGNDIMFSSSGTYTLETFTDYFYHYENWSIEQFVEDASMLRIPTVRTTEQVLHVKNSTNLVTLMYPVPYPTFSESYGTIFFMLNSQSFENLLNAFESDYPQNMYIFANDAIVAQSKVFDGPDESEIRNAIDTKSSISGTAFLDWQQRRYIVSYSKSNVHDWTFVSVSAEADALRSVHHASTIFIVGMALVAILGALAIGYFMKRNYSPIQGLFRLLNPEISRIKQKNELEAVTQAVSLLSERNRKLNEQFVHHRPYMKTSLLLRLIKGGFSSSETFNHEAGNIGLQLRHPYLSIAALEAESSLSLSDDDWYRMMGQHEDIEFHIIEDMGRPSTLFIISMREPNEEMLRKFLDEIRISVHHCCNSVCTIGAGNIYRDLSQLYMSYLQSSAALDFKLIKGANNTILFPEISNMSSTSYKDYPDLKLEKLYTSFVSRDRDTVNKQLEELLNYFRNNNTSLFMARCISFNIIHNLMRAMKTLDKHINTSDNECDEMEFHVFTVGNIDNIEELVNTVKHIIDKACDRFLDTTTERSNQLVEQVLNYINKHLNHPQFSIQSMCRHFSVSQSNLSHLFKKYKGVTLSQYISKLKMEQAKTLLLTTDLPLATIAKEIGYNDVSGFIRKFKSDTGVTPGEFKNYSSK